MTRGVTLPKTGLDGVALKPKEVDISAAVGLDVDMLAVDYEGREHLPDASVLRDLAEHSQVMVTTPVRADGFDPLGDDSLARTLPEDIRRILVAGHPAYLTDEEKGRAIAPRLGAARKVDSEAWVGTEGIERIAMAAGGTQFELLSRSTARDLRAMRDAGFAGEVAIYAPTVLTEDDDAVLDAVGGYVARRGAVARALPDDCATDSSATGRAREVLLKASTDFALVGDTATVRDRIAELKELGADYVVGYPARGLDEFLN
nr:luciferase [Haloarchaeobius amylolyticus]